MNEDKFTGRAENYDKYRAGYPDELIGWLYENTKAKSVADIGAGTGKFTQCLLRMPWDITAVEPNRDMLAVLKRNIPQVKVIEASAENTALPDSSVDLVTAATAFHWFDEEKFKAECRRILTKDGRLAVVFNGKVTDELVARRDEISRIYCGYTGHAGRRSHEEGDAFLRSGYFSEVLYAEFEQSFSYDEEGFIGNTLSRSYALSPCDMGYGEYVCELRRLFNECSRFGAVELKYKVTCYLGKL